MLLDDVDGALLATDLSMLRGQHGHFVGVGGHLHVLVVIDDWFHGLLVVVAAIITIHLVVSNVDHTWALTELAAITFRHLVFVERRSPVVWHLRQTSSLRTRLRNCAIAILVLLVHQINRRLHFLIGVRVYLDFI